MSGTKLVLPPIPEMLPILQILQVGLMMIGLLFKTDMKIGFLPISVFEKENPPLYDIPDEEWDIQQFSLLCSINQLVVQFRSA
jgi:hypothetical protein